jgi:hypothetical protein
MALAASSEKSAADFLVRVGGPFFSLPSAAQMQVPVPLWVRSRLRLHVGSHSDLVSVFHASLRAWPRVACTASGSIRTPGVSLLGDVLVLGRLSKQNGRRIRPFDPRGTWPRSIRNSYAEPLPPWHLRHRRPSRVIAARRAIIAPVPFPIPMGAAPRPPPPDGRFFSHCHPPSAHPAGPRHVHPAIRAKPLPVHVDPHAGKVEHEMLSHCQLTPYPYFPSATAVILKCPAQAAIRDHQRLVPTKIK